jgi:MOSC domain-containing protein YiiM
MRMATVCTALPVNSLNVNRSEFPVSADVIPRVITSIHIALATKLPMREVESAQVTAGRGIVGDRYEGTRHRHVSIQSEGELAEASERLGAPIDRGLTRRNVTVTGGELPRKPGTRLQLGEVELEVVRNAAPCRIMDFEVAEGARAALRRRGGVICRVLSDGSFSVGDTAEIPDSEPIT